MASGGLNGEAIFAVLHIFPKGQKKDTDKLANHVISLIGMDKL